MKAPAYNMNYEIRYGPSYSLLVVTLEPDDSLIAESGAMTYMQPAIDVKTQKREKSFWGTLSLALIGGQSFFVNEYVANESRGEVAFSAAPLGDIDTLSISESKGFLVQKSAYIASQPGVELDVKWEGFTKGLFGQGLFMIRATGDGLLFINTFGAIDKHVLTPGETLIVDNFHLVAFSESCQYVVRKFGGLKETILGGEGLVTEITGPGEVYIQTKNIRELSDWIWTLIAPRVQTKAR
ncbi:MAG: TIGR00266 family protein [Methanoregulaceae archaeon]|nr:TIGR00266 family protein [Methanoregulaceae archaeon]